jgi:hypothetical protein
MLLFGYTNPNILSRHQKETPSDGSHIYNSSLAKRMENFKILKDIVGEYPRVNKSLMPDKLNDFTINSIAANYKPEAGLFKNFYKGLAKDEKHYSYGQNIYIPPSYPNHFINTNKFSPIYLAEMKRQEKKDEFDFR